MWCGGVNLNLLLLCSYLLLNLAYPNPPTHQQQQQVRDGSDPGPLALSPSSGGLAEQQAGGRGGGWGLGGVLSPSGGGGGGWGWGSASPLNPFGLSSSRSAGNSRAGTPTPLPFGGAPDPFTGQHGPGLVVPNGQIPDRGLSYEQLHQQQGSFGGGLLHVSWTAHMRVMGGVISSASWLADFLP